MNYKRPFAPAFINSLDDYLLKHKPVAWSARTHLVVYYSLLFMAVLTLLCFLVPNDARTDGNLFVWVTLTAVSAFLSLIIWMIYLLRFNVFKRFGIAKPFDGLQTFLLYFLAIGMMVLAPYIPSAVETIRANKAFGDEELVKDANALNVKICQLEYDSIQHNWNKEVYIVRDTLFPNEAEAAIYNDGNPDVLKPRLIDTAELNRKLAYADSAVKINDSMYAFYNCPEYIFVRAYNTDRYTNLKLLSSKEIYDSVLSKFQKHDTMKLKAEINTLLKKYETYPPSANDIYYAEPAITNYFDKTQKKYNLYDITNNIEDVAEKKYRWHSSNWDSLFRLFYYITIVITLLVFIFRHSTVKTFFLTILAGFILAIITSLFGAFFNISSITVHILLLLYYFLFLLLALLAPAKTFRKGVSGIGLNMVTFFTLFVPLICVSLYYEILDKEYNSTNVLYVDRFKNRDLHFLLAEVAGIVLLLVLLEPLFKKLYRKWFSRPQE
jgi:hypothetical protein